MSEAITAVPIPDGASKSEILIEIKYTLQEAHRFIKPISSTLSE
jgi:hypothetical protein